MVLTAFPRRGAAREHALQKVTGAGIVRARGKSAAHLFFQRAAGDRERRQPPEKEGGRRWSGRGAVGAGSGPEGGGARLVYPFLSCILKKASIQGLKFCRSV